MKKIVITEEDIREFVDLKYDSSFAIAELLVYKWLKTKFNRPIYSGGIFDFVLPQVLMNEKEGDIIVEVKYNHLSLSPAQLRTIKQLVSKKAVIYLVSNKKSDKLPLVDSFNTPLGVFYCYKIDRDLLRNAKRIKLDDVPEYEELLKAIEKAYNDVNRARYKLKDLTLVSILVFTGCKLKELLALQKGDLDHENRLVLIPEKGRRIRFRKIPVSSDLFWEIIKRYTLRIPYKHEKLFLITDRQARNIVYKFTKRYLRRKIRPHAIRHSYAIFVLKHTRDLEAVRRLLGHSDYKWLRVYLNYTQEDLRDRLSEAFRILEHHTMR